MWRAMGSLIMLRDQVDVAAPGRNDDSDGLVGDVNHASTSGHYPHKVPGVGNEMVTAWDCTHDPAGGCDSYQLAETLRQHRDKRIRYVISNRRIFSSYASGSRPAWTWGPYTGSPDPHTNHAHIQVLDEAISDSSTPWNLEGFTMALTSQDIVNIWTHDLKDGPGTDAAYVVLNRAAASAAAAVNAVAALDTKVGQLAIPAPAPVDPAALKAVLLDPVVLTAIANAILDAEAARLAG